MNRIKYLRTQNGWTQEELAKMLSVQNAAISKYETGRVPLTDETLKKMSRIFNCSTDYLLNNTDDPTPPDKKNALSPEDTLRQFLEVSDLSKKSKKELESYIKLLKIRDRAEEMNEEVSAEIKPTFQN